MRKSGFAHYDRSFVTINDLLRPAKKPHLGFQHLLRLDIAKLFLKID